MERPGPLAPVAGGVPAPPQRAHELFGARLDLACRYADLLLGPGLERGLLGPGEAPRLWPRHLVNSAELSALVPGGAVVDIGSGAGLPGIPLALARPDLEVVLLDSGLRRVTFLEEVVAELGLGAQVGVVRARVEAWRPLRSVDAMVSRAVGPLERLLGWVGSAVRAGVPLMAMVGEHEAQRVRAGWRPPGFAVELVGEPATVAVVRRR